MNAEIEKVLEMHKSGTISSEQASALIRELNDEPFEKLREKAEEKSFTEKIFDHVNRFVEMKHEHRHHFQQQWQDQFGDRHGASAPNRNFASKIEAPTGSEFQFEDNSFITSHVRDLQLIKSSIQNCKGVSSNLHDIQLRNSDMSNCVLINTHAKELKLQDAVLRDLKVVNSEFKEIKLSEGSQIFDSSFKASSLQEITLREESEISEVKWYAMSIDRLQLSQSQFQNVEIFAAKMKDVFFTESSWMEVICKENRFKNFRMTRSHFTDVVFSGHHKFKKSVFEEVHFEDCYLKKVMFNDCKFDHVTFKNLTVENLSLKGLRLKDRVIDGNEALTEVLKTQS